MSVLLPRHPCWTLPFTVVASGEAVHLVAGEDARYSLQTGRATEALADLMRRCDGTAPLDALLAGLSPADCDLACKLLSRLQSERVLTDGPPEVSAAPQAHRLAVDGTGRLAGELAQAAARDEECAARAGSAGPRQVLRVFCQDDLNFHQAHEFNRSCLADRAGPWLWVSSGAASRGYVSPVFLTDGGPCLACLLGQFARLSPVPELYDSLRDHGLRQGEFATAPLDEGPAAILVAIARWKQRDLARSPLNSALFALHVVDFPTCEVSLHPVFVDPTCPECAHARMV